MNSMTWFDFVQIRYSMAFEVGKNEYIFKFEIQHGGSKMATVNSMACYDLAQNRYQRVFEVKENEHIVKFEI